jgi:hypothetical protein
MSIGPLPGIFHEGAIEALTSLQAIIPFPSSQHDLPALIAR